MGSWGGGPRARRGGTWGWPDAAGPGWAAEANCSGLPLAEPLMKDVARAGSTLLPSRPWYRRERLAEQRRGWRPHPQPRRRNPKCTGGWVRSCQLVV